MTYKQIFSKSITDFGVDEKTVTYMMKYYLGLNDQLSVVPFDEAKLKSYFAKLEDVKKGQPIQYVLGNVNFYGYTFMIKPGVLIPRFETEQLVYNTKNYIKKYFKNNVSVIDIGTGSGVIGLSLKKEDSSLCVTLTDISDQALDLALSNAKMLGVNVNLYKSDMLSEVIRKGEKYDVLISNPPYLSKSDDIMEIVKNNEPELALYGGDDGLKYYDIILKDAKNILNDRALIAFEIGDNQAKKIIGLAAKYFNGTPYEIKRDLAGRDRMFFLFYNLND